MTTYILIHGAFHGGWCWKRVTQRLIKSGHEVYAPTLTGLGERVHLAYREIGLDTHIQDVLNVLEFEDLHEVVLVGHSYGGMVITGVAEKCPERVAKLVYLDAFIAENGQSLIDLFPAEMAASVRGQAYLEDGGYLLPPAPPGMFGITKAEDLAWVQPRLVPQPFKTYLDPVEVSNPKVRDIPHAYIYCDHPHSLLEQFIGKIRADKNWQYLEITAGHDAMVVEPDQVGDSLEKLAPV